MKPHKSLYWLNKEKDEQFDEKVSDISNLYQQATSLAAMGERVISVDEKTGIQALERKHPTKPMIAGKVELIEFEYHRHGTLCLIANFDVASGKIITPTIASTRTEEDFLTHIKATLANDSQAQKWHFIADNLNIHLSESLVRFVAEISAFDQDLGEKGKNGILKNKRSRAAFLTDPAHKIVFHFTPKHASWMNQIEIWFSILVRKLLKRASFSSIFDLHLKLLAFIDYFNLTMAKPFKWSYSGKPLIAFGQQMATT